jgi:sigma54-dependent transcription regulator
MTPVDDYTSYYCLSMQHNRVRQHRSSPQSTDTLIEATTGSHLRITAWLFEHAQL